ncbi:MAG TPA: fibronectin type III domain-containing protein [Candidatus Polarisedimenticolia bacterium]|nr:fibronectin type III domain-containing protein [Candidatus Polarisedimenticolia bacterium]
MRISIAIAWLMILVPAARGQTQSAYLAWTPSRDAAANSSLTYNVYRAASCAGRFAKINAAPVTATTYLDNQPPPGMYCYRVTAVLSGTESAPSNTATATILPLRPTTKQFGASLPADAVQDCSHAGSLIRWIRCIATRPRPKPTRPPPVP